jgi:hypothetical protein
LSEENHRNLIADSDIRVCQFFSQHSLLPSADDADFIANTDMVEGRIVLAAHCDSLDRAFYEFTFTLRFPEFGILLIECPLN